MLHKSSDVILPKTLQLLKKIQQDPVFDDFFLVGGTALALQLGHRLSIDLDFFTEHPFSTQALTDHLYDWKDFILSSVSSNTVLGVLEGVKTDFITHAYPLVDPLIIEEGLRLASLVEIGAMKLNAIAHSGQRLKDFIDVYFLLESMTLRDLLTAYSRKYPKSNQLIPLKALVYFEDINIQIDKPMVNRAITLSMLKRRLEEAVLKPEKIFKAPN